MTKLVCQVFPLHPICSHSSFIISSLTILYHHSCGAWKAVTATKTLNGLEWPPLPRSKVTTKWMTVQEGPKADGLTADYTELLEMAKDRRELGKKGNV